MKRRIAIHLAYFLALGLAFAGAVALAGSVGTLTTFSPNTVAKSSEVNGNFSAVKTAVDDNDSRITANESDIATNTANISTNTSNIASNAANIATNTSNIAANAVAAPRAWGQSDVDLAPSTWTNATLPAEINHLDIDVPSDGILVISGSVYIESGGGNGQSFVLAPYVDGFGVPEQTLVAPGTQNNFAASFQAGTGGTAGQFPLSYTVTVQVTAGPHIVVQNAGPLVGTVSFDYNKNYLTVVFYPSTHGTFVPGPPEGDF